ncbi:WD40 repeat domain-containing protein [Trichocoleus sp. DQ-U1]|uniref:WD40 repeat domain-containing protein n=1 Tax=Trichocoleus sp. DQ-U1 TaxID=2933926 RepID=UPI003297010B
MTEQIREKFIYNGGIYYLAGLEPSLKYPVDGINSTAEESVDFDGIEDKIFDFLNEESVPSNVIKEGVLIRPHDYGMKEILFSTACRRGFHSTYEIINEELFLKEMTVGSVTGGHKPIEGVMPTYDNRSGFCYRNLKIFTRFTGTITLGKDFIDGIFLKPLLGMTFYQGKLVAIQDLSLDISISLAVIFGGLEAVKRRLASAVSAQRILALSGALYYGESGLDLVIPALLDESAQVMWAAYSLLRTRTETKVKIALQEFNPYQFFECLCTFEGHSDYVSSVAIAPDGETIVSGSGDMNIKVWDILTGKSRGTFEGHLASVDSVAIAPDGKTFVSASRDNNFCGRGGLKSINVWDILTGKCQRSLQILGIFPDGKTLIHGRQYKTIKGLDIETRECLRMVNKFLWDVYFVAIAPNDQTIVSSNDDNILKVWDIEAGKWKGSLQGHSRRVYSVAIALDGRTIVSGSKDNTIKVWDLVTCECKGTLEGHSDYVLCVAIATAGKTIVSGSKDNTIKVWDLETCECRGTLEGHSNAVSSVAITPDGRTIVSGSYDNTIKVWGIR